MPCVRACVLPTYRVRTYVRTKPGTWGRAGGRMAETHGPCMHLWRERETTLSRGKQGESGYYFPATRSPARPPPVVQYPRTTCHAQVSMEKGFETRQFIVMHCHSAGWAVAVDCNTVLCKKNGLRIHNTATLMSGHSLCAPYAGEHHRTRARLILAVPISRKGPLEVGKFYSALPGTLLLLLRTSEKVAQGRDVRARLLCTTLGTSLPTEDYTYVCMRLCGRRDARSDVSQGTTHRPHRGPGDGQLQLADMDHVVNAMPKAADWPVMRRPHIFFSALRNLVRRPGGKQRENFHTLLRHGKAHSHECPQRLAGGTWRAGRLLGRGRRYQVLSLAENARRDVGSRGGRLLVCPDATSA